jgi:5-methylthioribose kinase
VIYTEPYNDAKGRNIVTPENLEFVKKELYGDKALHLEIAKLKFDFMNNAQALLHGDLHTGSIFVKPDSTIIFDPEFAFYGPMGYDIGNVVANLFFAWDNGDAAGNTSFCEWTLRTAEEVIDLFKSKFIVEYRKKVTDLMARTEGFAEYYLDTIIADTAAGAGTELVRRTVGMAQVKDVTTIADRKKRVRAERINILCAKDLVMNRTKFKTGKDFTASFGRAIAAADKTF